MLTANESGDRKTRKLEICEMGFSPLTMDDAVGTVVRLAKCGGKRLVVPVNVDVLMLARSDRELRRICLAADVTLADGMPIVWLSRLIGQTLPERVTGADMLPEVCRAAAGEGLSVFFLGGMHGAIEEVARRFKDSYRAVRVAGTLCPPFGFEDDDAECAKIVAAVNAAKPDLLFIGLGAPKQEKWLWRFREELQFGVALCVGAAFDFAAGLVPRAPRLVRAVGCEWLWRLAQEPKRLWRRYILRDTAFVGLAIREVWRARVTPVWH